MRAFVFCFLFIVSHTVFSQSQPTILIVGDSLSAGYGIDIKQSWPVLLQEKLSNKGHKHKIHNASISGQTSSEGVRQIDQLLQLIQPELVILELGANDGLRGLSVDQMQQNLQNMITKSLQANAQVLLIGIRVPSNYGRRYSQMITNSYIALAKQHNTGFVPFMLAPLENVITADNRSDYIQSDGLHPTAKAQPLILEHLWPSIAQQIKP